MASAALASSFIGTTNVRISSSQGGQSKLATKPLLNFNHSDKSTTLYTRSKKLAIHKRKATVQATYSGRDERPSSASIFVGGFILGGVIVGALGCAFAPQISKALAGADRKELLKKLPKFIYDEEKALEKTRKVLADKIAELNGAIDDISLQLRADSRRHTVVSQEAEASVE